MIASSIVSEIRNLDPPGRFLARKGGKENGFWYDIGDEKARDKTSQALRENAPSIRAEIETEINEQRKEMKAKDEKEQKEKGVKPSQPLPPQAQPPVPTYHHPPPPPHGYYDPRAYWDYYYYYYHGYAPPAAHGRPPSAVPPYPHPQHPGHPPPGALAGLPPPPPPPPGTPIPPPPAGYPWGALPHVGVAPPVHPAHSPAPIHINSPNAQHVSAPSSAQLGPSSVTQEDHDREMAMALQHQEKQAVFEDRKRRLASDPANKLRMSVAYVSPGHVPRMQADSHDVAGAAAAASFDMSTTSKQMTQEELDHRYAVALQEQEDNELRYQIEHTDRRASRSSAFPMHGGTRNISRNSISWVNQGANASPAPAPVANNSSSSTLEQILPTSFMAWTKSLASGHATQDKGPQGVGDMRREADGTYSPINLEDSGQSQIMLPPVTVNMLDSSVGSWENSNTGLMESSDGNFRVRIAQIASPKKPRAVLSSPGVRIHTLENCGEGQEVELMDVRDEPGMSPFDKQFSRVGTSGFVQEGMSISNFYDGRKNGALSPAQSLDMDESGNSNLSGHASLGGQSLSNLFAEKDEAIHRVLQQVPSWERSMRSRSPLSMSDYIEEGDSMIRVRNASMEKPFAPLMEPIKDDPNEAESGMDWE